MSNPPRLALPRALFLSIVVIELAHTVRAILQHRIPMGHDGFQYFALQYYFLNNAIQSHEVAQWIPFMTHGTVSTFWYGIQGSFLQNVLLYTGPLLRSVDLLSVYHVGLFVDEMILLTGTWLLARRFFRTPAVFFVAVSVVGSCVWLDQPYWNFRLYYAIPLILELGHRFLETARWRWFFLALNLLALQTVGNLPYFIPVVSFVVAAYFVCFAVVNPQIVWERARALRWGWAACAAIALGMISFVLAYGYLTIGTDQLASYNPGRAQDGSLDLGTFLTYGGVTDLHKWIEMVLNLSPWLDLTLYGGILLAPLLLIGVVAVDRRRLHLVLIAATLLLFTLGTPVSTALFYAWPGMKYFRHIGLVSPLVKVLFCFVAAIGFEWLFEQPLPTGASHRGRMYVAVIAATIVLVWGAWLAHRTSASEAAVDRYIDSLTVAEVDRPLHTYQPDMMRRRLKTSAMVALAGAVLIAVVPLAIGLRRFGERSRVRGVLPFVVLLFVTADVYHFKFAYLAARSDVVWPSARFVTHPSVMPYPVRREPNLENAPFGNDRVAATARFSPNLLRHFQGRSVLGAIYWTNNAFWFTDEAGSSLQVDSWLAPLDQLMRLFRRLRIDSATALPGFGYGHLDFPPTSAAARVSGVTTDKIRFFSQAYAVNAPGDLAPLMADGSYRGNELFVFPVGGGQAGAGPPSTPPAPWPSGKSLAADESLPLRYEVQRFDANNLVVKVSNPEGKGTWVSYADVWHPSWHATVNGRWVPLYRANMAYKAVPIDAGDNIVHFQFGSRLFSMLAAIFAANAAFWLCAVGWMMWDL